MQNTFLNERTASDIDRRVARVLRDLGRSDPPLELDVVRDLLSLDLAYYSSSDAGVLNETVHKLRIGARQIIMRPRLLWEVVQRLDLRALFLPDRKRILLDADLPGPKQRWGEAHEIGHSLIPWHQEVTLGDKERTLSVVCHQQIEAEANYAAGRLLFLRDAFAERVLSEPVSFGRLKALSKEFRNTMTSTLWRTVESLPVPAFGMVGQHPRYADAALPMVRYFLRSRSFEVRFATITATAVFRVLGKFCFGRRGPIGTSEVVMPDVNGDEHVFLVECFNNGHDVLTLAVYREARASLVAVP